jgi:hypothetical protein
VETLKKLTFIGVLRVVPSDRANLQACLLLLVLLADTSLQYCVSPYVHRSIGDDSLNAMEFYARLPLSVVLALGLAMDAAAKDLDDPLVTNGSSVTKDHLLSRLSALTGVLVSVVVLLICYCISMILHYRDGKGSSVGVERVSSNPLEGNDAQPAVVEVLGRGEGRESEANVIVSAGLVADSDSLSSLRSRVKVLEQRVKEEEEEVGRLQRATEGREDKGKSRLM